MQQPQTNTRLPEECAQAQLEAYNDRDILRFADVYADNVELIDLATGVAFCSGRQALIDRFRPMFEQRTNLHCHLVQRVVCPPFVFDEERVLGLSDSGEIHAVATYECANGVIQRAWFVKETAS